jgi:hypothetical protein
MLNAMAGRTARRRQILWLPGVVLPFLFLLAQAGCREDRPSVAPSSSIPFRWKPGAGDYAVYDNWKLDAYGNKISGSKFRSSRTVTDTAARHSGYFPVVVLLDSLFGEIATGGDTLVRTETHYLYASPDGDIFQYGFLASVVHEHTGLILIPQWDRLSAFSLGIPGSWTVGYADSAGRTVVSGMMSGERDFLAVLLNGLQTAVPAYRIDMSSGDFEVSLWLSDSPTSMLRFVYEPSGAGIGSLRELTALHTGDD